MSTIVEEIMMLNQSILIKEKIIELYLKIENKPLLCGDSAFVDNFWIETHTLGCRNAADCPESEWLDEHFEIYDEYANDNISTVIGAPEDGIFITITEQLS